MNSKLPAPLLFLFVGMLSASLSLFGACKRDSSNQPRYPQQNAPTSGPWAGAGSGGAYPSQGSNPQTGSPQAPMPNSPSAPSAPAPATPSAPAPGAAPAPGFACTSDADLQCPFAHCLNARCGGCSSDADCKPFAACLTTPLGAACVPSNRTTSPPPTASPSPAPTPAPAPTPPPAPPIPDRFAAARARCVQRTNELRAKVCADGQAARDANAKTPHGAFGQCGENAQNECPAFSGTPDTIVDRCLQMMFAEGPGDGPQHGHYVNLTNAAYRSVACGFHVASDGSVWLTQNLYR
jgi:hypothetical protein